MDPMIIIFSFLFWERDSYDPAFYVILPLGGGGFARLDGGCLSNNFPPFFLNSFSGSVVIGFA